MDTWADNRINEKKEVLAYELTALVHGEEEAKNAQAAARALFAGGGDDAHMPTTELTADQLTDGEIGIMELLTVCKLIPTRSEGRRLIQQGGVTVNEEKVTALDAKFTAAQLQEGLKIRKGKKVYHKAILK
jgi:tyrosyl-tRNA synthetase